MKPSNAENPASPLIPAARCRYARHLGVGLIGSAARPYDGRRGSRVAPDDRRRGWLLEQKPNVRQVLRAYTATGTYTSFQEHRRGTLEVGKLADLVVLDANPFAVEPENLAGISVLRTVVDGGQRFGDDDPC